MASHFHVFGVVLDRFFFPQFSIVDSKTVRSNGDRDFWYAVTDTRISVVLSNELRISVVRSNGFYSCGLGFLM